MIKLLGLLFTVTLLYSGETIYILPDHQTRFVHQLNQSFKKGSKQIVIAAPSFNHSELKKGLLQAANHGSNVTMILCNLQNDPLSMVQYERITLHRYTAHPFDTSIILIDNTLVCTLSGSIDQERSTSTRSRIRCSDDIQEIESVRHSLKLLYTDSKPYLE